MIEIVRSPCASSRWHWVYRRDVVKQTGTVNVVGTHCSVYKSPLRRSDSVWAELDLADLRIVLRDLYVPKGRSIPGCGDISRKYGGGLIASSGPYGRMPTIDGVHFCTNCLAELFTRFHKEIEMKCLVELDLTKPIVVCSDGSVVQADTKTLIAAKKLAKEIVEGNGLTAVVFKPHTQYERQPPPVVEIKL